ncbi:MAG: RluA family pseudouridine synthase [Lachnospiraceae bacterium]|nr:RluA family pseudouridine synthase [Lachnospiraceae bacterium]
MTEYTISGKEEGLTLIRFSSRVLKEAPNGLLYKFLRNKNIELNGKKSDSGTVLKEGDKVSFFLSDETFEKLHGHQNAEDTSAVSLESERILYEDEDYLFYDKPAGLRSQSDGSGKISLNDLLLSYTGAKPGDICRPSVCNRLDTNTSGIVLCGKSVRGLQTITEAIREHRIRKYYRAILKGHIDDMHLVSYLFDPKDGNKVSISDIPQNGYKEIITELKVIEANDELTYAELYLITGRKHQIRAQSAHAGHPVAGDRKYGDGKDNFPRHMLHSYRTELPDDILNGLSVFAPIPSDMRKCLEKAGIRCDLHKGT